MTTTRRTSRIRRSVRRALLLLGPGLLLVPSLTGTAVAQSPPHSPARSAAAAPAADPAPFVRPPTRGERGAAARMEAVRNDPDALRTFLESLPKGADLHNHLSGAVRTEVLIDLAVKDGLCIRTDDMTAVASPCGPGTRAASDTLSDAAFREQVIRAWSMKDFDSSGGESGHDHFFATFGKFSMATWDHAGPMLADVADTAAEHHEKYLETMVTPASDAAKKLADQVGWHEDFAAMHAALTADGKLDAVVQQGQREADTMFGDFRRIERCGTALARPGCRVEARIVSQVSRASTPQRVFTQMEVAMALAERDHRFVAVNLVQPEDAENSLRHYRLHMRMLDHLHGIYPDAHITLHAGELAPGLVKPEDLRFHIDDAVRTGHAERIGHGVDVRHEDNYQDLLRTMAARHVTVEAPLSSNDQILGISGAEHPFQTYRGYGVPVALSTDDPGVSRIDLTHEYQRATTTYGLTYPELKDISRQSLEASFLPGRSLWSSYGPHGYVRDAACAYGMSEACRALLAGSEKARQQWALEQDFQRFERVSAPAHAAARR